MTVVHHTTQTVLQILNAKNNAVGLRPYDSVGAPYNPDRPTDTQCKKTDHEHVGHTVVKGKNKCPFP